MTKFNDYVEMETILIEHGRDKDGYWVADGINCFRGSKLAELLKKARLYNRRTFPNARQHVKRLK